MATILRHLIEVKPFVLGDVMHIYFSSISRIPCVVESYNCICISRYFIIYLCSINLLLGDCGVRFCILNTNVPVCLSVGSLRHQMRKINFDFVYFIQDHLLFVCVLIGMYLTWWRYTTVFLLSLCETHCSISRLFS